MDISQHLSNLLKHHINGCWMLSAVVWRCPKIGVCTSKSSSSFRVFHCKPSSHDLGTPHVITPSDWMMFKQDISPTKAPLFHGQGRKRASRHLLVEEFALSAVETQIVTSTATNRTQITHIF